MPEVRKSPVNAGGGFLEVASRMRTARLVRPVQTVGLASVIGPVAEEKKNPLEDFAAIRERLLESRAMQVALDEQEAEVEARQADTELRKVETQVNKLEAQDRLEELRTKRGGGSNDMMITMLGMMQAMMESRNQPAPELTAVLSQMATGIGSLKEDILGHLANGTPQEPNLVERISEIAQLKETLDVLFPRPEPSSPVPAVASSLQEAILMAKLANDHQLRMLEIDEAKAARTEAREAEQHRLEAELQRTEKLGQMLGKGIEQFAPILSELAAKATSGVRPTQELTEQPPFVQYPPVTAMPANITPISAAPYSTSLQQPELSEPTQPQHRDHIEFEEPCPHCFSLISFPTGVKEFSCPKCGNAIQVEYSPEEIEAGVGGS